MKLIVHSCGFGWGNVGPGIGFGTRWDSAGFIRRPVSFLGFDLDVLINNRLIKRTLNTLIYQLAY